MRIAVVTKRTLAHSVGGIEVHTDGLVGELRARGHDVTIITTAAPAGPPSDTGGPAVQHLPGTATGVYSTAWFRRSVEAVIELDRQRRLDAVVSEDVAGSGVCRHSAIPHVAFLHGLALEHVISHWRDVDGVVGAVRYPLLTVPELLFYAFRHELTVIRRSTLLGAVNHRVVDQLRRWYRVPSERIEFLPYWVDVQRFRPDEGRRRRLRDALELTDREFLFLTASVLTRQKGVHLAIAALARCRERHSEARLLVVGDGPYRPSLQARARALGLGEAVRFVGAVSPARMPDYGNAADAFVFPTLRMESTGIVLLEAMASTLPVVASRIAAVPEVVGDAGLLVRPGDVAALAAAMGRLVEDRALRQHLGIRGRSRASTQYAKQAVMDRLEAVCAALAERRR